MDFNKRLFFLGAFLFVEYFGSTNGVTQEDCDGGWEYGVGYPQNDLKNCKANKKSSAQECKQFCSSISNCVGWEWGNDGDNCCAKSALQNKETGHSGRIAGKRNSCPGCDGSWENDVAYPHNDLKPCEKNKKSSAQECQQFCLSIPECVGWEWGNDGDNCCAKSALENKETGKSGQIAGMRNSCKPDELCDGDWEYEVGYPHNDIKPCGENKKSSAQECQQFCWSIPECVGWEWGHNGNNCCAKSALKSKKYGKTGQIAGKRNSCKPDTLLAGRSLKKGYEITSLNNNYQLKMQGDGNLVIYKGASTRTAIWSTGTNTGCIGNIFKFQNDGNLVIYSSEDKVCWTSHTAGKPAQTLRLTDDGILALENGDTSYWTLHTSAADVVGKASLSTQYSPSTAWGPLKCLDGNADTTCHTNMETYPFFMMEYPSSVTVMEVKVQARNNDDANRVKNVVVTVTDRKCWKGEKASEGSQLGSKFWGPASKGQWISFKSGSGIVGKYVVVQQQNVKKIGTRTLPRSDYLNFAEVEIKLAADNSG